MKRLLLLLGAIASVNAFALTTSGNTTPQCTVLNPLASAMFFKPGELNMKPGTCYQVTQWTRPNYETSQTATLVFQLDGNVVLYVYDQYYNRTTTDALNLENKGGNDFIYQEDNNLVVYGQDKVVWTADSDHNHYDHLVLEFTSADRSDVNVMLFMSKNTNTNGIDKKILAVSTNGY